ncbi:MAG: MASE1 domain-containing protein [Xanthomonadaceae bacterium]|nr:MASE1 domain-containing protein [Xanthomonadaceae bacterium]MDE1963479.1 MASE1 domain-containing protein [Xanthomonadaceae bacterium]
MAAVAPGALEAMGYEPRSTVVPAERLNLLARGGALPRQLGVAVAYFASVAMFGRFPTGHWVVLTGLHLGALLLVDYRYWPALFVGDLAWLGYLSARSYERLGPLWALVNLIPPIAWYAPLVLMFREHWGLDPARGETNMPALVLCAVAVSGIATMITIGQLQVMPLPMGSALPYAEIVPRLVFGHLLGALALTPVLLLAQQGLAATGWRWATWLRSFADSRLAIEVLFGALPCLVALYWIAERHASLRDVVQLAMFLPAVVLAMRHGWGGAAIGGLLASVMILTLMPSHEDAGVLPAEAMMAAAIAALLIIGARLAYLDGRGAREQAGMQALLAQTRMQVRRDDADLREIARALEEFRHSFRDVLPLVLESGEESGTPAVRGAAWRGNRRAASLPGPGQSPDPSRLAASGWPELLGGDRLARALGEAGLAMGWDVRGPLGRLAPAMVRALTGEAREALADASHLRDAVAMRVRIRCGVRHGGWAVAVIRFDCDPARAARVDWDRLASFVQSPSVAEDEPSSGAGAMPFTRTLRRRARAGGRSITVAILPPPLSPDDQDATGDRRHA